MFSADRLAGAGEPVSWSRRVKRCHALGAANGMARPLGRSTPVTTSLKLGLDWAVSVAGDSPASPTYDENFIHTE